MAFERDEVAGELLPTTAARAESPSIASTELHAADTVANELSPGPAAAVAAANGEPSQVAGERYRLGEELARGGMGVVYRATDLALAREVAIKTLTPKLAGTEAARRFVAEARITGKLQHPSVPPIHDLGTLPDGRPFLAMKLIRGQTLSAKMKAAEPSLEGDAADRFDELIEVFRQVCLAVAFAHSRRVIHRDLKPQNVMVGAFGEVQVMDWGLAKELAETETPAAAAVPPSANEFAASPDDRTMTGQVMGTPSYMPPEQARGETARIDERADVFALGGILCAILTGRPPYVGRSGHEVWQKAVDANLDEAIERLDGVQGATRLAGLAKRCLDPNPARRPAHAGEVAAAVHTTLEWAERTKRGAELSQATGLAERQSQKAERRSREAVLAATVVAVTGGLMAFGSWAYVTSDRAERKIWAETTERNLERRRKADASDQLLDLEGAVAFGVEAGRFEPGWDGPYRDRIHRRLDSVVRYLESKERMQAIVLQVAAIDAAKERDRADSTWYEAAKQMADGASPEQAELELAVTAAEWRGIRKPIKEMDRLILTRALRTLDRVSRTNVPDDLARRAAKAQESLKAAELTP